MDRSFKISQTSIKKFFSTYKISIPDFQRKFVWKLNKKQQLIDSLTKGFPIGAITLYDNNKGLNYYIIDGLQRINTLRQYMTSPNKIIKFNDYYKLIEHDLEDFYYKNNFSSMLRTTLKRAVRKWYENLSELYEYEKLTKLYKEIGSENSLLFINDNIDYITELHQILMKRIAIHDEEIAIIIYFGDKNDLPDLFKNINTGSVALSQYEILQSIWNDYKLDGSLISSYLEGYRNELELMKIEYEIEEKEEGDFDIFKNIVGLNNKISQIENADLIFTSWKKYQNPVKMIVGTKYFDNESIGFEIYSSLITGSPNRITNAVDLIFKNTTNSREAFLLNLNDIIIESIRDAIAYAFDAKCKVQPSKYHSMYLIYGIIMSKCKIDVNNLRVIRESINESMISKCTNFCLHRSENWFIDENRQVSFYNDKLKELLDLKTNEYF